MEPFLDPLYFSILMTFSVFICMGIFISISNNSFESVGKAEDLSNPEIYSYFFKSFLYWFNLRKPTVNELAEERDKIMRSKYIEQTDLFVKKANELVEVFDKLIYDWDENKIFHRPYLLFCFME